jgi:hypothetical protein
MARLMRRLARLVIGERRGRKMKGVTVEKCLTFSS